MTREEYSREYRSLVNARDLAVKVNDKKIAKHYRQQISRLYEEHGKDLKESPIEQAEQDRLKAELYDKLKALIQRKGFDVGDGDLENIAIAEDFDAAVKALPDA